MGAVNTTEEGSIAGMVTLLPSSQPMFYSISYEPRCIHYPSCSAFVQIIADALDAGKIRLVIGRHAKCSHPTQAGRRPIIHHLPHRCPNDELRPMQTHTASPWRGGKT